MPQRTAGQVLRRARPPLPEHLALLALRLLVGTFLVWGVLDNLLDRARMLEFARFLDVHGFPWPLFCAHLSAWAQLLCGLAFITGIGFRTGGLLCAVNFTVAIAMVDHRLGIRGAFPAAMLTLVGLYFAARGPGPLHVTAAWRQLRHGRRMHTPRPDRAGSGRGTDPGQARGRSAHEGR